MKLNALKLILGLLTLCGASSFTFAQQTGYVQSNLTADTAGVAAHTDPQLSNPWGISFIPVQAFRVANNNGGTSTVYDAQRKQEAPDRRHSHSPGKPSPKTRLFPSLS